MKPVTILAACFFIVFSIAQEPLKESMFEGELRGKPMQLFIQTFEQDCTQQYYYRTIVRFKSNEVEETVWRKFHIYANTANGYLLVDDYWNVGRFNNYIYLEQDASGLSGFIKSENSPQETLKLIRNTSIANFESYRKEMEIIDAHDDC